ncbi:MAG: PQQ-binding-like beta-propeller repeat protein [Pirellulales bacterium]
MIRLGMLSLIAVVTLASSTLWAQVRSPLISEITARRYGLTRSWFAQVDLDRSRDRVQSIAIHDRTLFVQTKRGVLQAIDAETGKTMWVNRLGSPLHPTTEVGVSDEYVAALNGSTLYVFERATGKSSWSRRVVGAPGAGPGISKDYIFVPTINGILEAYNLEQPRKPAWLYNAGGRALVQPFVASGSVSWPTDRGSFYVAGAETLTIRYRTEARDDIVAQAAHIPPFFYFGSLDGNLYKVHERSGNIAWRFTAGEPVAKKPVAINGRIYVAAMHGGLYCVLGDARVARSADFDARQAAANRGEITAEEAKQQTPLRVDEGAELWWAPEIVKLLAVTPSRIYGLDRSGRMRICRADTGSLISTMSIERLSLHLINHVSDRIYVGTKFGLIQCLHEPRIEEPLAYLISEGDEDEGKGENKPGDGNEGDIFAGGKGGKEKDPFAAGGDGDDPFGDKAGGEKDPFGDKAGDKGDDPFGDDPFGGGAKQPDGGGDAGGNKAGGADDDPFGGGAKQPEDGGADDNPAGGGDAGDDKDGAADDNPF